MLRSGERELRNLLASTILELDEISRIALALYYFEGLTFEEISVVLGLAVSVEPVIRNALQQLRDRLTARNRQKLRFYLDEALESGSLRSPTLAFAARRTGDDHFRPRDKCRLSGVRPPSSDLPYPL